MNAPELIYDSDRRGFAALTDIVELLRYRDLIGSLVLRDLTVRYKRSVLGFLWTMLNPLLIMLVMTIVFSHFFSSIEHYPVYLLSGLLVWNFFSQSTQVAANNLIWAGGLVNKIYLPKSVFIVSAILVGLVNLLLALIPLILIVLFIGVPFSFAWFFLPVPILLTGLFALGVGLIVSTLAVFFVDVVDIYQIALTVLMYLTPLFYPIDVVPQNYLVFIHLNPVYYFVQIFRQPIYQGVLPDAYVLFRAGLIAIATLVVGWWLFTKKSNEFAYRV